MVPDRFPVIPEDVLAVLDRFSDSHAEAFCVGGCVRDALRGVEPNDWDLCTILRPEETLALFSDHTCIPTGMKHGTITVLTKTGRPLEITTYRVDGTYADHRRPDEVTFSRSLSEDCSRRAFTVNAMAYHPKTGIVDHY
ncbi:MAG: polynucleotide adenylyltransferase, partial [Clostridia bacterium]|nr:polynucleotide adenylyltransferase [Clostridia bacterium]